ncbi:MAG: tetratricopeptide repeat protein, partial [Flavobacteriales bacterium]|nr:tetratricopeptide repeat protein [Flavobacteriales bacterium]
NAAALAKMDSIMSEYPGHALSDEILWVKADIAFKAGDFKSSEGYLQDILSVHFKDILADDALFRLAEINELVYLDLEQAAALYERIILEYPGSLFVIEARKRFRRLRGDNLG